MTASPSPHRAVEAQAWTPEPWRWQREVTHEMGRPPIARHEVYTASGAYGHPATCEEAANAARIVACVNAMKGIADPAAFVAAALAAGVKP